MSHGTQWQKIVDGTLLEKVLVPREVNWCDLNKKCLQEYLAKIVKDEGRQTHIIFAECEKFKSIPVQ